MTEIIFATGNKDKMREIREIMADCDVHIVSMKEAGIRVDIVEDGTTFEENAKIKARAVAAHTDAIVLADDSGLEIDALNKEPGVYSARYMGEDTSYDVKNKNLIDRLDGVPKEKRTARFVCAIAAVLPDGRELVTRRWKDISAGNRKGKTALGMIRFFIWMNTDAHRQRFLRNRRMRSVTEARHCVR